MGCCTQKNQSNSKKRDTNQYLESEQVVQNTQYEQVRTQQFQVQNIIIQAKADQENQQQTHQNIMINQQDVSYQQPNILERIQDNIQKRDMNQFLESEEKIQIRQIDEVKVQQFQIQEQQEDDIYEISELPLNEKYRLLLQDLRFDYMQGYKHHYANIAQRNGAPPQSKMIRLTQELTDLSGALPCEHTNSIFIRVDKEKVDLMKAVVMGSSGTPYAHGAFEYDIFFQDNYPNSPPQVNLETTGGGQVRFNPNLYNCGKVCLSLLGTWGGNGSENWDPKLSTILQVLISLQSIVMSDQIYFNEPGSEYEAGTEEGKARNEGYSNIVRYSNIRYAMIDQMRSPIKGFETVIKRHFYLKQFEILKEVNE